MTFKDNGIVVDLFCGAGGASHGYAQAGFTVCGIDNDKNAIYNYPYARARINVYDAIEKWKHGQSVFIGSLGMVALNDILFFHASPPCQVYVDGSTKANHVDHIRDIADGGLGLRTKLEMLGKPYIIENVDTAPLARERCITLCGTMFDLKLIRHRLFEFNNVNLSRLISKGYLYEDGMELIFSDTLAYMRNNPLLVCSHSGSVGAGDYAGMYGNGVGWGIKEGSTRKRAEKAPEGMTMIEWWKLACGNDWMGTLGQLRESIPWAYTYAIGMALNNVMSPKECCYCHKDLTTLKEINDGIHELCEVSLDSENMYYEG